MSVERTFTFDPAPAIQHRVSELIRSEEDIPNKYILIIIEAVCTLAEREIPYTQVGQVIVTCIADLIRKIRDKSEVTLPLIFTTMWRAITDDDDAVKACTQYLLTSLYEPKTFTFADVETLRSRMMEAIEALTNRHEFNMTAPGVNSIMQRILGLANREVQLDQLGEVYYTALFSDKPTISSITDGMQFHDVLIRRALLNNSMAEELVAEFFSLKLQPTQPATSDEMFTFDPQAEIANRLMKALDVTPGCTIPVITNFFERARMLASREVPIERLGFVLVGTILNLPSASAEEFAQNFDVLFNRQVFHALLNNDELEKQVYYFIHLALISLLAQPSRVHTP